MFVRPTIWITDLLDDHQIMTKFGSFKKGFGGIKVLLHFRQSPVILNTRLPYHPTSFFYPK